MLRTAIIRSFLTGLGIAVVVTACAPENLSGPQASLSTPSAALIAPIATSPGASASAGLLGAALNLPNTLVQTVSDVLYPVVQRKHALPHPITVTRVIGVEGGTIAIVEAGLTITFSRGALLTAEPITVTADSGSAISYEFGPHGIHFSAPVTIKQDMRLTTLADKPSSASNIQGGYTPDGRSDIVNGLLARVAELRKATTTVVIGQDGALHLGTSSFIIKHFSGYILIGA